MLSATLCHNYSFSRRLGEKECEQHGLGPDLVAQSTQFYLRGRLFWGQQLLEMITLEWQITGE